MAFVTPKNIFSPLTNKTTLFLWIFIALLFAVIRMSGGKVTVQNTNQKLVPPQVQQAKTPTVPKLGANKEDSYLPFEFNKLDKEDKKPKTNNESLNDLLQQLE